MTASPFSVKEIDAMRDALPARENVIPLPGTDIFFDKKSGLLKGNGNNVFRAWYNQTHAYKDLGLRVVYGSLGLGGEGQDPFFEYGHENRLYLKDFVNPACIDRAPDHTDECKVEMMQNADKICYGCKKGDVFGIDMHCWLEDKDERIYDVSELLWLERAETMGLHVTIRPFKEIKGKTRALLKRNHGLHYVKAPEGVTQTCLEMYVEREFRHQYDHFLRKNLILTPL